MGRTILLDITGRSLIGIPRACRWRIKCVGKCRIPTLYIRTSESIEEWTLEDAGPGLMRPAFRQQMQTRWKPGYMT